MYQFIGLARSETTGCCVGSTAGPARRIDRHLWQPLWRQTSLFTVLRKLSRFAKVHLYDRLASSTLSYPLLGSN